MSIFSKIRSIFSNNTDSMELRSAKEDLRLLNLRIRAAKENADNALHIEDRLARQRSWSHSQTAYRKLVDEREILLDKIRALS